MNWLIVGVIAAVVIAALVVMAVLAERRDDPAPERDIGALGLPAVRGELVLRDVQHERHQQREAQRTNRYRNDRGDTP
ncbi:hypothetical protein SAMN04488074_105128 [Lentzea albidocapillata subsp. violacea]|uniref:Uncharacterized protein n=1 Tax=Lentzea albidocapillata subsp. violacea TaxID=128104 RepID=A0A1G9AUT2_9PSEU|nr:hypothetical protein [Lentzea albidocapillata]SDK31139.1 hypothetical protein SAMN04488074_105128 [Lentzea albidocapillata subsp. violacea]